MQKGKITDYESFRNEIQILMQLVSVAIKTLAGSSEHNQAARDVGNRENLLSSH
jgi:hypothetical protein